MKLKMHIAPLLLNPNVELIRTLVYKIAGNPMELLKEARIKKWEETSSANAWLILPDVSKFETVVIVLIVWDFLFRSFHDIYDQPAQCWRLCLHIDFPVIAPRRSLTKRGEITSKAFLSRNKSMLALPFARIFIREMASPSMICLLEFSLVNGLTD